MSPAIYRSKTSSLKINYSGYFHSCETDVEAKAYKAKDLCMQELNLFMKSYRAIKPRLVHWNSSFCKLSKEWPEDLQTLFEYSAYHEFYRLLTRIDDGTQQRMDWFDSFTSFKELRLETLKYIVLYFQQMYPCKRKPFHWLDTSKYLLQFILDDFECERCIDMRQHVLSNRDMFFSVEQPAPLPQPCLCLDHLIHWVWSVIQELCQAHQSVNM